MISKPIDKTLLAEKSTEVLDIWTTVCNSRKNRYNNNKNIIAENYEVFNENEDLTKGQFEENICLHEEETESEDDSTH